MEEILEEVNDEETVLVLLAEFIELIVSPLLKTQADIVQVFPFTTGSAQSIAAPRP